ncbi:hypothetical protein B6U91_00730, partial [Candidatus Pacearchaeota archaeon ex4484_71]
MITLDILKIPEDNELTYTNEEFEALKIPGLGWKYNTLGYGNRELIDERIKSMLKTPLSRDTLYYRKEFFSELMNHPDKKTISNLIKDFPSERPIHEGATWNPLDYLEAQRLVNFPRNLERLSNMGLSSGLFQDFVRFSKAFLEKNREFVSKMEEINKKYPPRYTEIVEGRTWNGRSIKKKLGRNNRKYQEKIIGELSPFQNLYKTGASLRYQFMNYLLFSKICEKGCDVRFFGRSGEAGEIRGAIHPFYNQSSGAEKRSKFGTAVANNILWNKDNRLTLITGANSGGKSVYLRTIGINILLAMNGFYALADSAMMSEIRRVWPAFDFGDARGMGHLEKGLKYFRHVAENASRRDILLMDEPAQGAEPAAEYQLAKGNISKIAEMGGFNSFIVTHDIELVKEFLQKEGVSFKKVADYGDKDNKYGIFDGLSEGGYGMRLAKKMGADPKSLENIIKRR